MFNLGIDFLNYAVVLFVITGLVSLRFDVKAYQMADMEKEKKVAKFLAWGNMLFGSLLFVVKWVYNIWF